jgi:NhaP-type Na+/H+ or K+/H+ antiporter
MAQHAGWSLIYVVLFGVLFGAVAGALMVWATDRGDQWQQQASTVLEITAMTTLACVIVSYMRQFFLN